MSAQRILPSSWLHDDTEEDLVGADWHQRAIHYTVESLRDLAADADLPWHVGDQLPLICSKPDGSPWRPSPDVMLHPEAGPEDRDEMDVSRDGLPALIVEVASPTTWKYDVDIRAGKAWGYMQLGVPNYLVFDPTPGEYPNLLGEPCRGWQWRDGAIRRWEPEADGRYRVNELGIAFMPEGALLRVIDLDGAPVPFTWEKSRRTRTQDERILTQDQRIARLEAELARIRGLDGPASDE